MPVLQAYIKGALRRKKMIASFVEQFQLTLENTRCPEFQFYVANFSQQKCIIQGVYYAGPCTIDAIDGVFGRAP